MHSFLGRHLANWVDLRRWKCLVVADRTARQHLTVEFGPLEQRPEPRHILLEILTDRLALARVDSVASAIDLAGCSQLEKALPLRLRDLHRIKRATEDGFEHLYPALYRAVLGFVWIVVLPPLQNLAECVLVIGEGSSPLDQFADPQISFPLRELEIAVAEAFAHWAALSRIPRLEIECSIRMPQDAHSIAALTSAINNFISTGSVSHCHILQ